MPSFHLLDSVSLKSHFLNQFERKSIDTGIAKLRENPELWLHFARAEEYGARFRDRYGRFPYYLSANRDIFDPSVSRWLVDHGLHPHYPKGKRYAICLTHDIDAVYHPNLSLCRQMARSLRRGRFKQAFSWAMPLVAPRRDPLWNFDLIQKLESRYDAKSSFYFLALARGEQDFNYKVDDLRQVMLDLRADGWEVGLHGGHRAYLSLEKMKEEKSRLEDVLGFEVVGYRNHYLRFQVPDTWRLLEQLEFSYDTSFGYPDCVGFRNGVCHPFRPFDLEADRFLNVVEIPLILMDCSLMRYMRLGPETAWELTKSLLDIIASLRGVATVVWHNPNFEGDNLAFYERLLQYGLDTEAWMAPALDIARWWQTNEFDKVYTSK